MNYRFGIRSEHLILLAAAIWGIAFYFQKTAMFHIGPLLFIGLRCAIASAALLPFAILEHRRSDVSIKRIAPITTIAALVFFAAATIQQHGIVTATVINTGFLTALYVVVTPFAFWAIERQLPPTFVWASAGIAFIGVWSLSGGSFGQLSEGDWLVTLSTIGWGVHIVVTGRAGRLSRPVTYSCMEFAIAAAIALSLAGVFEEIEFRAVLGAIDSVMYVGILSTALTFGLMSVALQHIAAPKASIILSTEVLFSAAAGYVLLGERLTSLSWFGAFLILLAVLAVRLRTTS